MAKLTRQTARVFGENATPNPTNNDPEIGQFGSAKAGYYTGTGDIATIQGLDNGSYWSKGWINAVTPNQQFPALPEMTGVHKVLSYQNAYVLQEGIPEYDAGTTYYQNSICKGINAGGFLTLYKSLTDDNLGNALTNTTYWKAIPIEASGYANTELSNLTTEGNNRLHALKGYEDAGELLTDSEGLADVTKYAHSTFDVNKFEKTGSDITITADGIASGFASTSDLLTDYAFNPQGTWKIKCAFTTPATLSDCSIFATNTTFGNRLQIYSGYLRLILSSDNASYDISGPSDPASVGITALSTSTKYYVELIFDGSKYEVKLSTDNQTWTTDISINNSNSIYTVSTTQIRLGKANGEYEIFTGSIDLKEFYIVEDGVITFRGNQTGTNTYTINGSTVTIPYTLSKTGSKIVDSAYRTQVSMFYNAYGFAPYYTLNEGVNFTVPQGELYGMMLNRATPYILRQIDDGNGNGYIQYSNNTCIQYGRKDVSFTSSSTTYDVSLTKSYANASKYRVVATVTGLAAITGNVSVYVTTFYTDKFTLTLDPESASGTHNCQVDWYAIGKI